MVENNKLSTYAKELTILLVDDDPFMHEVINELVGESFKEIDHAKDGEEAFEIFQKNSDKYDFVMTDIQMPKVNGVELVKKIRHINEEIPIVVASAHDDASYLIELINHSVQYFFSKPIGVATIPEFIRVCANVMNDKIIKQYQILLENSQAELEMKNRELEQTLKELKETENKNIVLTKVITEKKPISKKEMSYLQKKKDTVSADEFHSIYPSDLESKNTNMELIEENLDITISKIISDPRKETFESIGSLFNSYADNILLISEFSNIGLAIQKMADAFYAVEHIEKNAMVEEILYSISKNIETWRVSIFDERTADDIHYLDNSLIGDCMQVEMMIKPKTEDDEEEDIEFF